MLIDPYYPGKDIKNFPDLDGNLRDHYDYFFDSAAPAKFLDNLSPRYRREVRIGYRDIFYYINRLYDNDPESIIDVGCAECIWKRWFPRITGFDPMDHNILGYQDFVDYFDEDFSRGHQEHWDNGMALNSIHFVPWSQIGHQIDLAMNLIRPGGRFLFTFNFVMIDEYSQKAKDYNQSPDKDIVDSSPMERIDHMDQIIKKSGYTPMLVDYPELRGFSQDEVQHIRFINGTVRFILEK